MRAITLPLLTAAALAAQPAVAQHANHGGHAAPLPIASPSTLPAAGDAADHAVHQGHGVVTAEQDQAPELENAADAVWGAEAMAAARQSFFRGHSFSAGKVLFDRFELDDQGTWTVDGEAWHGGDIDKAWLKFESEGDLSDGLEGLQVQALWSHAIDPWFNLQSGVRQDLGQGPDRTHLVVGVQGLAPYWIEVDAALFLSAKGDLTARIEVEHDARITQRLILQPRIEAELAAQDVPELGIGAGLSKLSAGARLRYQVTPTVGPYVGVEYSRAFGETRNLGITAGNPASSVHGVIGVRAWF